MSEESCANCRFWRVGRCRKNPPSAILPISSAVARSEHDEWCGEWRQKGGVGTTGKLYQLPNGQWITPSRVSSVVALSKKDEFCADENGGFGPRVWVSFSPTGANQVCACDTLESAEAMRDKIAADVNAMVGGGVQVEASLADENKKLRAFAKEVIGAWPDDITISADEIGAAAVKFGLLSEEFGPELSDYGSVVRHVETSILSGQQK